MLRAIGCILLAVAAAAPVFGQPLPIPVSPESGPPGKPVRAVLMFLPQQLFSEDEFEAALRRISRAGIQTRIASSDTGVAVSMSRVVVNPDISLRDAQVADYAGLVLIGGSGAALCWDDSLLQARCRQFAESGRVVAAIGIAPITLARAGVLKGRKATVFHERSAIGWLKEGGAKFSFRQLVADRNIITASGAEQAPAFGEAVAAAVLNAR